MPRYTFRSNLNTPLGAIHPVDLDLRVLASLRDAAEGGIEARYDWHDAEIGTDEMGDYVVLVIEWPDEARFGTARQYINQHFVTIE